MHQKSNLSTEARVEKNGQRGKLGQKLGGGNSNIFGIFTPKIGEDFQFDEHIFQMG